MILAYISLYVSVLVDMNSQKVFMVRYVFGENISIVRYQDIPRIKT